MTFPYLLTLRFLPSLPLPLPSVSFPPPLPLSLTSLDIDDPSLMLLTVLPFHDPMTIPRGNGRKRSRGSFSRNHKPSLYPREGRNTTVIAQTDLRLPSSSTCQPHSRSVPHRRRKRRRFSPTNGTPGVLQNHHLLATSHSKPVFPTPPPPSTCSPCPSPPPPSVSSRTDEERTCVISERLRLKMSKSSSTTARGNYPSVQVCTFEDWQDIKELFAKAAEQYNGKHVPKHPFSFSNAPPTRFLTFSFSRPPLSPPSMC